MLTHQTSQHLFMQVGVLIAEREARIAWVIKGCKTCYCQKKWRIQKVLSASTERRWLLYRMLKALTQISVKPARVTTVRENPSHAVHAVLFLHLTDRALLTIIIMDNLEVLHRGLCDSTMEIQNIGLGVIIPDWCFVVQLNDTLCIFVLPPCKKRLVFLHTAQIHTSV